MQVFCIQQSQFNFLPNGEVLTASATKLQLYNKVKSIYQLKVEYN